MIRSTLDQDTNESELNETADMETDQMNEKRPQ